MHNNKLIKYGRLLLVILSLVVYHTGHAQLAPAGTDDESIYEGSPVKLLNEISGRIAEKKKRRDELNARAKEQGVTLSAEELAELAETDADIKRLQQSLVLSITGKSTLNSLYAEPEQTTTWQEDIVDVIKPLADSLKNLTRRPREIAELRASLVVIEQKQTALKDALDKFALFDTAPLEPTAKAYVARQHETWTDDLEQLDGEELLVTRQLEELLGEGDKPMSVLLPNIKRFFAGTGLTLLMAVVAGGLTYFVMRGIWWLYSNKVASKNTRRKSTLYRLSSYSFHLVTGIFVVLSVLIVLYAREDLLLLAIAFLLLAGLVLNLKQFLPRYITEARLLLNLGSVREEERVLYNGLPWQVKSINLYSVLHNPALDGIVRLPLQAMRDLVSRPVRNNLWFPTQRGDYVILPDGMVGQVKLQTPDLVELTVRGGMAQTFPTADFYSLNIINLTRDETFGVSVTFGLDYGLQSIAVTEIPEALYQAVMARFNSEEVEKHLENLIVELSAANSSSLDYLVWAKFDNKLASDYYRIERMMLQACVELCNERDWTIPFPQLTIHQA